MTLSRLATALFALICSWGLLIGTAHAAPAETPEMVVAVYGVADLVIPLDSTQGSKTTEESLMTLVRNLVDPASWEDQGGEANVQFYPVGYGLVVRQTAENQELVAKVLTDMRRPCKATCFPPLRQGSGPLRAGLFDVEDQPTPAAEQPHKVGGLFIAGNELTQSDHILSFVDLCPGQPLDYPALRASEINLARSGLFDTQERPTVTVIDRDDAFNSEYKDIVIRVKEAKTVQASMLRMLWRTKETFSCVKDLANYCTNEIAGWFIDVKNIDKAPVPESTPEAECPKLVTRIYPVADLIIPIDNYKSLQIESAEARWQHAIGQQSTCSGCSSPMPSTCPCPQAPRPSGQQTLEEQLIRLITRAIEPQSWSDVGGPASIQYYPIGNALVVNQTDANQEQIAELLASLRKLQNVEVAVETRLVSVSPEFAEQVMSEGGYPGTLGADGGLAITKSVDGVTYLSDVQLSMFLEAAQGDRRTNVMQAPKITVFNGQTANINVGDEVEVIGVDFEQVNGQAIPLQCRTRVPYGVFMTITPVVSEACQNVRSKFSFVTTAINSKNTDKQFVESLTLEKVIDLGDGQTALFHLGKTTTEARKESKTPLLWRLPVVGEHFRQVSYEPQEREMFLMITTRVIINEEEAMEFRGELQPRIPR
ncbi:MAG TPA: hypothetical protein VE988_12035 [Gemmataceae bacterium]|nr:hypothetical protein [Gemmataceae bacterium]